MRRRRREDEETRGGVEMRDAEGGGWRRSGSFPSSQPVTMSSSGINGDAFRIRRSRRRSGGALSWSSRTLLVAVTLLAMMAGGGVEALQCQCSRSTEAAHCSHQLCDIKPREGKVPACVFVRAGPLQHYACIRVKEEEEMGCRVMRSEEGGEHRVACMCRDADMCNVDLAERVDDGGSGGGDRRLIKVPAELIGEPSVVRVRAEERRPDRHRGHDVLLEPDRDDTLGVAPSVIDFFDEETEVGVGTGGGGRGRGGKGGLIQRETESWSDEEDKRSPSASSYRVVQGVDNGQLVPLSVKRLGEERRSKLEENVIDLTDPYYRRPVAPPAPSRPSHYPPTPLPPVYHTTTRRPDWRQPGAQPVPHGPYEAARLEQERRRKEEEELRRAAAVHRVEWTTRSRLVPPAPTTTTTTPSPPAPPALPSRSGPTPFTIGRISTFIEAPSPDPVPYPSRHWDDRPVPATTPGTTTTATTEATTARTRRPYSVSVSRYAGSTTTTTTPEPTTTEPATTTTSTTTTTTTTTTERPTTTVRSTVAPSTTTVVYDDIDEEDEKEKEYDDIALAGSMKNAVPREESPDSGTASTIWTTVVVTAALIVALW